MMHPKEMERLRERAPFPVILTLILLFAPGVLTAPQRETLESTAKAFDGVIAQARNSLRKRTVEQGMAARRAAVSHEMERLDAWLPPRDYLPTLIERFDALAGSIGVQIKSAAYRFPAEQRGEQLRYVEIHLSLQASYQAMRSFLQAVEEMPSPLVLTEVVAAQDRTFTVTLQHLVKP